MSAEILLNQLTSLFVTVNTPNGPQTIQGEIGDSKGVNPRPPFFLPGQDLEIPEQQHISNSACAYDHHTAYGDYFPRLHLVVNNNYGQLYHRNLSNGGAWSQIVSEGLPTEKFETLSGSLACAVSNQDSHNGVHVFVVSLLGEIFHNYGGGDPINKGTFQLTWLLRWEKVNLSGGPSKANHLSCAFDLNGNLHLFVVDTSGSLWHNMKAAAGNWQTWNKVRTATSAGGSISQFSYVSAAKSQSGDIHLCAIENDRILRYTRYTVANPGSITWSNMADEIRQSTGNAGDENLIFTAVQCSADHDDVLHFVAVPSQAQTRGLTLVYGQRKFSILGIPQYSALVNAIQGIHESLNTGIGIGIAHP